MTRSKHKTYYAKITVRIEAESMPDACGLAARIAIRATASDPFGARATTARVIHVEEAESEIASTDVGKLLHPDRRDRAPDDARRYVQTHSDGSDCYRLLQRLVVYADHATEELEGFRREAWERGPDAGPEATP